MNFQRTTISALVVFALAGCASIKYGDKETEAKLRQFQPIPDKTSLYVCREAAAFVGAGNRTTVVVDGKPIGTLKPGNFAHTIVDPGTHDIFIKLNPGGNSGTLPVSSQAGEAAFVWIGMVGGGWGGLSVDFFSNRREAENCVKSSEYSVPAD